MDLFSLILVCAVSSDPRAAVHTYQIAQAVDVEVTYIDDLTTASGYSPADLEVASGLVSTLMKEGHDIRVGLGQIPARVAYDEFGLTPEQMLDPCTNIAVATELLEQAFSIHSSPKNALAFYLKSDSRDPQGLRWADYILSKELVDLDAEAFNAETPKPSRRFSVEVSVFSDSKSANTSAAKSLHASSKMFVKFQAPSKTKSRFESMPLEEKASEVLKKEISEQPFEKKKSRGSFSKTFRRPQANVTDEKLLTSDELLQKSDKSQEEN